ncbi:MAG: hypothetical protein ACKOAD_04195 [Gammaproteobacteria bacterium]
MFRHWLSTAQACDFSEIVLKNAIEDLIGRISKAIEVLASRLPPKFPENIFEAITQGMLAATETIKAGIKIKKDTKILKNQCCSMSLLKYRLHFALELAIF